MISYRTAFPFTLCREFFTPKIWPVPKMMRPPLVTHPVIGGYQLLVQSEIIWISHMQFASLPLFQMKALTGNPSSISNPFKHIERKLC